MTPRPSLEWHLTDLCNYRCPYCCEGQHLLDRRRHGHAGDATIRAVLGLLERLPGSWQVKFSGAEETIHPRFMEVCRRVIECGHTIALTTNFSPARPRLEQLAGQCGPALEFLNASLHLGQVDPDKFIDKAIFFQGVKDPATDFTVCAVVTEENFDELMAIQDRLEQGSVAMAFQVLKVGAEFRRYPEHIEKAIKDSLVGGTESIRSFESYGTPCHTGQLFFVVKPNGMVFRCFSKKYWYNYMGNIRQGSFSLYDGPRPCLADVCTCVVPANRNMIRFGESSGALAIMRHKAECLLTRLPNLLREPLYRGGS